MQSTITRFVRHSKPPYTGKGHGHNMWQSIYIHPICKKQTDVLRIVPEGPPGTQQRPKEGQGPKKVLKTTGKKNQEFSAISHTDANRSENCHK